LVREIAQDFNSDLRFQGSAVLALQEAQKPMLLGCSKTKTCALFTPSVSLLCLRTSNRLVVSVSVLKRSI
jgi:histone H3